MHTLGPHLWMPLLFSLGLLLLMICGTACNDSDDPDIAEIIATNGIATATMPGTSTDAAPESVAHETDGVTTSTNASIAVARRPCVLSGDDWTGVYYNTAAGKSETITARVSFGAEGITIQTSKRSPPGQSFRGTVNNFCRITAIDQFDGEDWTTKFGGADDTQLRLADFVIDEDHPIDGTNAPPLNVIELFR